LGVPLTSIDFFCRHQEFYTSGERAKGRESSTGKVLLVDDSATICTAIKKSCQRLRSSADHTAPFKYLDWDVYPTVLFGSPNMNGRPYLMAKNVAHPRVFAWNWLDSWATSKTLFDFDGVLCQDPVIFDDNPAAYEEHIRHLPPLYVPKRPILGIVTNRLERFREATEEWLKAFNVKYKHLIMRPEKTAKERRVAGPYGLWKGQNFLEMSEAQLFVESDQQQSERIFKLARKPVLWPAGDRMYS
jgi:hypothetical protein